MKPTPEDRLSIEAQVPPKGKLEKKTPLSSSRGPRQKKNVPVWSRLLRWSFIILIWAGFVGGLFFLWYSYDLPDITKLQQTERRPSITILAKNGTKLATYGDLHGQMIEIKKLPPHVIQAILAIEDRRFYSHFGVDLIGLLRAFWANYRAGHVVQGGSTITQQLAKNFLQSERLFGVNDRSLRRKIQEALLALWLEHKFTKEQILTMYLNRVYLGSGTFGIAAASQHYFGKEPQSLSLYEAAVIAGLLKAPSKYSPSNNSQLADQRAAQVLENMVKEGNISEGAKEAALALASSASETFKGSAIRYFTDWIVDLLETKVDVIDTDLVVTTTLDPHLQTLAEEKLIQVCNEKADKSKFSQMALVSMDYEGAICALLGGVNYKKSQFNRATQALRQVGSAFKPILYLAALEAGMTPMTYMSDLPVRVGSWKPKNMSTYKIRGEISLQDALAYSSNTVTVRLAQQLGLSSIVQSARRLGITAPLPDNLTIVLGTGEVTLLDLTSIYAVFARQGVSVAPYAISKITDLKGHVLYVHRSSPSYRIIDSFVAQELTQMLQAVMLYGTGKRAAISGFCAGKTGTTQKDRDAWLIGFTSNYITGVWAGNDDNASMNPTAGSPSSRLWHLYMSEIPQTSSVFQQESVGETDSSSGGLIGGLIDSFFGR